MTRHSKIYPKINSYTISEEWRDDLNDIVDDLQRQKETTGNMVKNDS